MEDDHVDRTGVEAWQHVKLTVTNSSIDFIVLIATVHHAAKASPLSAMKVAMNSLVLTHERVLRTGSAEKSATA